MEFRCLFILIMNGVLNKNEVTFFLFLEKKLKCLMKNEEHFKELLWSVLTVHKCMTKNCFHFIFRVPYLIRKKRNPYKIHRVSIHLSLTFNLKFTTVIDHVNLLILP